MRERLDCAVLSTSCTHNEIRQWFDGSSATGRLHLQALKLEVDAAQPGSSQLLAGSDMVLRRFDACLITVSERNLAWVRTSLLAARGRLHTPLIALAHGLKAAALDDLYSLGLADFVRLPVCVEELRTRVERQLDSPAYRQPSPVAAGGVGESQAGYGAGPRAPATEDALCASILDRTGLELEAFAVASASRSATSRESFKAAKSQVIERFERAYITAALGRHSGNIAMAARSAQKHRRAFWALMRKHQIDAAPYRAEAQAGSWR
jgi:hypothetical protein